MSSAALEGTTVSPDVQPLFNDAVAKLKEVETATDSDKPAKIAALRAAVDAYVKAIETPLQGGRRRKTRGRKHGRKTRRRHF
jgi:hypothetical protein